LDAQKALVPDSAVLYSAIKFSDQLPQHRRQYACFLALRKWLLVLDEFDDDPRGCGEEILEAIQAAKIEEAFD
jgi:FeS assembly protein IscX